MANVEIYTWKTCPFCIKAKSLLDIKNVKYNEHMIQGNEDARAKMVTRTGGPKSVPQIFIDDKHIGGCDDLHALENEGKLDKLLG